MLMGMEAKLSRVCGRFFRTFNMPLIQIKMCNFRYHNFFIHFSSSWIARTRKMRVGIFFRLALFNVVVVTAIVSSLCDGGYFKLRDDDYDENLSVESQSKWSVLWMVGGYKFLHGIRTAAVPARDERNERNSSALRIWWEWGGKVKFLDGQDDSLALMICKLALGLKFYFVESYRILWFQSTILLSVVQQVTYRMNTLMFLLIEWNRKKGEKI